MAYAGENASVAASGTYAGETVTNTNPVSSIGGFATEHATAVLIIGCLAALMAIRAGFRGVSVAGVKVGV